MTRILITGNLGYIGGPLARHLKASHVDATLIGLDLGLFADRHTSRGRAADTLYSEQIFASVNDVTEAHMANVDAVVHLAAISNDPMGERFSEATHRVNFEGSLHVARVAKAAGVKRFVFASSCSVYGDGGIDAKTEQDSVKPLTAYARSKIETETALTKLASEDFLVTCLRFATACGHSDRLRLDLVLNEFVAMALFDGKISVLSDGTPLRPLIHVNDMSRAIAWSIFDRPTDIEACLIMNAGYDRWNFSVREIAESVAEICGCELEINTNAAPDKRSYKVSFVKYRELSGHSEPLEDFDAYVTQLRDQVSSSIQITEDTFRGGRFRRLVALSELLEVGDLSEALTWV